MTRPVRVVQLRVGYRGHGDGGVEDVRPAQDRGRGQVSAVRRAADRYPAQAQVRVPPRGRVQRVNLVLQRERELVAANRMLPASPRPGDKGGLPAQREPERTAEPDGPGVALGGR
jgi:hypothetical protein